MGVRPPMVCLWEAGSRAITLFPLYTPLHRDSEIGVAHGRGGRVNASPANGWSGGLSGSPSGEQGLCVHSPSVTVRRIFLFGWHAVVMQLFVWVLAARWLAEGAR